MRHPYWLLIPIVQAFTATAGIEMETKDISLLPILSISGFK
jgi:monomeric isocitrate dehydrogenase